MKQTITIQGEVKEPWNKPNSNQFWYSVATKEYGEPIKFIQDKDKNAPSPRDGHTYTGNVYEDNKGGIKFYAFGDKPPKTSGGKPKWQPKDERQITRNMVWKNMLSFFDAQTLNSESKQWDRFWLTVDEHTDKLLEGSSPIPQQTTITASLSEQFKVVQAKKTPPPYDPMLDLPPVEAYDEEEDA